ncbi:40S ribosomal protein S27 [Cystobasidiomycetes sp. EMM_F5]
MDSPSTRPSSIDEDGVLTVCIAVKGSEAPVRPQGRYPEPIKDDGNAIAQYGPVTEDRQATDSVFTHAEKKRLVQGPNSYFMDVKCPGELLFLLLLVASSRATPADHFAPIGRWDKRWHTRRQQEELRCPHILTLCP